MVKIFPLFNDESDITLLLLSKQLYLVRTMLESLVDKGDKSSHRHTLRRDMDGAHVTAIDKFLQQSFLWPQMMDLHGSS